MSLSITDKNHSNSNIEFNMKNLNLQEKLIIPFFLWDYN